MLLAATSFQAGNMSLPDFRKLQEEDEYCKKVKAMATNDSISKQFHVRQGILLRIYNPGQVDPNRRKIRPPTIVLPAALVDMIIDSEHVGPLSAHLSAKRVYLTLREKYIFRTWKQGSMPESNSAYHANSTCTRRRCHTSCT